MSDAKVKATSTEKKEFSGEFYDDLTGTLLTVNLNEWGIRGKLKTDTDKEIIYVITYEKTPKTQIPFLSKGDKVTFTRVWVSVYKGKVAKWNGKDQALLCKNGVVKMLQQAERTETVRQPENNAKPPQALTSDTQTIDNLQLKIEETQESLIKLHKIASLQESVTITTRDFLQAVIEASLQYHRVLCSAVRIIQKEE
ncbi:MAG: hypothetical protein ACTSO7_13705 [Candidatus Heimdallarchaeota archaeon]